MLQQSQYSTKTKKESNQIYSGGHVVGRVTGNIFLKTIQGSKHILRKPQAIAISIDALEAAERAGATTIQITDTETGVMYKSSVEHFRGHAFELDRGFGPQLALTLEGWTRTRRGALEQLGLFGGAA
jgi:hypothetical protein